MTSEQLAMGNPPPLLSLLDEYQEKQCKIPRDKVFGLIGIANQKDVFSLGIDESDERNTVEVYTQLAQAVIRKDKNFNIFGYLGSALSQKGLPTWVPDWAMEDNESQPLNYSRESSVYAAGGKASPSVTFSPSGEEMITHGTILYKITRIGVVAGPGAQGKVIQDWEAVLSQNGDEKYISGESISDAFISTVLTGHPCTTFATAKRQFLLGILMHFHRVLEFLISRQRLKIRGKKEMLTKTNRRKSSCAASVTFRVGDSVLRSITTLLWFLVTPKKEII